MGTWTSVNDFKFVNPYNFVSLGDIKKANCAEETGDLTGVINCSLKTVTPLAIPDSGEKTEETIRYTDDRRQSREVKHNKYPFYRVGGQAVIPGSEIRGMIRSVYEAVTHSCMSVVNTNILSARRPFPRQPGLIRYNAGSKAWELFKAKRYKSNKAIFNRDVDKCYVDVGGVKKHTGDIMSLPHGHIGYLLIWVDINQRYRASIFELDGSVAIRCVNLEKAVENFHEVCNIYTTNTDNKEHEDYKKIVYDLKNDGKYYPVWYEEVSGVTGNNVYLSPACISRSVFDNRLEDLLGDHAKKCKGREKLCPACRLFGMIGEKSSKSLGSSLRFSDAVLKSKMNDVLLGYRTLKTLANPKTSAVEFYTERPANALTWSYDYKTTDYSRIGNKDIPKRERAKIKIKGRKFYLHNLKVNGDESIYTTNEKANYNSTMELVKKDIAFGFEVYFENITDSQLKNLVSVLTLRENDIDGKMCHKLGHGKPLGLGSVKIFVDSVITRKVEIAGSNVTFSEPPENTENLLNNAIKMPKELLKIADTDFTKDVNVSYPLADAHKGNSQNSTAAHQWFSANRSAGVLPNGKGATELKQSIKDTLPSISTTTVAQRLALPKYEKLEPKAPRELDVKK